MSQHTPISQPTITLRTTVAIPAHVVLRAFPAETVVLNLMTGLYHSLNPTGGRMLEVLGEVGNVQVAVEKLAAEYGQPAESVARDVCAFCHSLAEHGLIEVRASPRRSVG